MNGFMVCGNYLELLDLIPGLPSATICLLRLPGPQSWEDVEESVNRDGDVAMLVNIISPVPFLLRRIVQLGRP